MKNWFRTARRARWWIVVAAAGSFCEISGLAQNPDTEIQKQIRQLQQQNDALQQQLRKQGEVIDELNRKVLTMEAASERRAESMAESSDGSERTKGGFSFGKVHLSGEGGVGLFHSQPLGQFPNTEFRVDEAKLFVEAPIWGEVYAFTEINFFAREVPSANVRVGELYLDFENVSRLWRQDRQLNLRVGRFDIPFGEEYLTRDAIDNPLISHSLMDLWGVDEGVEAYGALGPIQYVLAVQNGGHDALRDYNSDKAVIARIGADPAKWLHTSISAMRTGEIDVENDEESELWLGSGFVRSLGSAATTVFEANLLQGDVHLKFPHTTFKAAGGVLQYDDDDPAANNEREVYYYSLEAVQKIYRRLYAAARWSQVFAPEGFPIPGNGDVQRYYEDVLTERLWQLSLGLGYRFSDQLVLKAEYTFARGNEIDGTPRDMEDMFAIEAAFAF